MPQEGIYNPALPTGYQTGGSFISWIISSFISVFMLVGFVAMIFYFIFAGFMLVTSGGDQKKVQQATHQITNALIGMGLIAAGWALMKFVGQFFGLDFLEKGFKLPSF